VRRTAGEDGICCGRGAGEEDGWGGRRRFDGGAGGGGGGSTAAQAAGRVRSRTRGRFSVSNPSVGSGARGLGSRDFFFFYNNDSGRRGGICV
jgi:hypothetical protein